MYKKIISLSIDSTKYLTHNVSNLQFTNGIIHPDLLLWDSFGFREGNTVHLYAMAASRNNTQRERHLHSHWRHFYSNDNGSSWRDMGVCINRGTNSFDSKAIWSGTVKPIGDNLYLAAYTGLSGKKGMIQSINIAVSNNAHDFVRINKEKPLLSPINHYDLLKNKGYYLDDLNKIGDIKGEEDGAIMALRDPYIYIDNKGNTHLYFAAKKRNNAGIVVPAIGHLKIQDLYKGNFELSEPFTLPDSYEYVQLELPNVFELNGETYLTVNTTDRRSEDQPTEEITREARLYKLGQDNQWHENGNNGSSVIISSKQPLGNDKDIVYGINVIDVDEINNSILFQSFTRLSNNPKKELSLHPIIKHHVVNHYESVLAN